MSSGHVIRSWRVLHLVCVGLGYKFQLDRIPFSCGADTFRACLFAWNENENELEINMIEFIPNTHPFPFWLSNSKDSGIDSSFLCGTYNYSDLC